VLRNLRATGRLAEPYTDDLYELIPGFLAGVGVTVLVSLLTARDTETELAFDRASPDSTAPEVYR
jgi:hypothetical protein